MSARKSALTLTLQFLAAWLSVWLEPERGKRMSWATFIKAHLGVIVGMDFFTVEAMTWLGLVRYRVLLFRHTTRCT